MYAFILFQVNQRSTSFCPSMVIVFVPHESVLIISGEAYSAMHVRQHLGCTVQQSVSGLRFSCGTQSLGSCSVQSSLYYHLYPSLPLPFAFMSPLPPMLPIEQGLDEIWRAEPAACSSPLETIALCLVRCLPPPPLPRTVLLGYMEEARSTRCGEIWHRRAQVPAPSRIW